MYRGSSLSLDGGRSVISTDSIALPPEFGYGSNTDFVKVFILSYAALLCDTPFGRGTKSNQDVRRFISKLSNVPILDTIRSFSSLYDELVSSSHVTGSDAVIRPFISAFKQTPIFWEYHHWYMNDDPKLFTYISSFLLFGKKLSYKDESFDATAFRGWLEVEEKLSGLVFKNEDLDSLRAIVTEILGDVAVDHLLPRHGGGKVADRDVKDIYDKVTNLRVNPKLAYAFHRSRPYWTDDMGFGAQCALQHVIVSRTSARLKFVPKDVTKSRSICMEPVGNMYYQQEVLRWLKQTMKKAPIRRFVNMADQTINQKAALTGSITGASDTIDLSSASDSVSIELVKGVFADTPRLKFLLLATRSSATETPDGVKVLKKFAPMGSAVCFPIQCIIFTAVCLYSYMSHEKGLTTGDWTCTRQDVRHMMRTSLHRGHSVENAYTSRYLPPVVFGDDIIIDHRAYDQVITTLERLGFSVNESKSFAGAQAFRESCGVFALNGSDVSPFRFRLPSFKTGTKFDTSIYTSLIATINNARTYGYFSVATYLQSILTGYGFTTRIPFTTDSNAFGILVSRRHSVPVRDLRWNADWQTYEERVLGVVGRKTKTAFEKTLSGRSRAKPYSDAHEQYSLDQWWRSRVRDQVTFDLLEGSRPRPQETRLVPVWSRYEV